MTFRNGTALAIVALLMWSGRKLPDTPWQSEKHQGYELFYTSSDRTNTKNYVALIKNGITSVNAFFNSSFHREFNIYVHPTRRSLDSVWQKDWNMPEFKSECWMVASGVAHKLDLISPQHWGNEACEHRYSEIEKTQQLITHELVHVYHGQQNASPDFSNVEGIDWLIEGLATYASGQCDRQRIADVKQTITDNKTPSNLDNFWKGKLKYGLSGSLVMYIDHTYGRAKLKELLALSKKTEVLVALKTTEPELLNGWKNYIEHLSLP